MLELFSLLFEFETGGNNYSNIPPDELYRNCMSCRSNGHRGISFMSHGIDGSTDNTEAVMAEVKRKWGDRFVAVTQKNTGKGGALMHGLKYATCDQVFLSDADTFVPPDNDGMGYMLAEIESRGGNSRGQRLSRPAAGHWVRG